MIENSLRPSLDKWLINPLLSLPFLQRIRPIQITLLGLLFGLMVPLLFQSPYWAVTCLLLSGLMDILDGAFARKKSKASQFGAILDITSDRLVEFATILALFLIDPAGRGLQCILMLGGILFCVTTFLVVGIFSQNSTEKSFYYHRGLMERAEAFAFFILMFLFPSGFSWLGPLFTFLVFLTGGIRIWEAYTMPKK